MPRAESGGESFARPTRRSIDTASVMGLKEDGDEIETGGESAGVAVIMFGADSSAEGSSVVGSMDKFLELAVFANFDWCFKDFLAILVRLYSFRP